jgi:hypothetical protein
MEVVVKGPNDERKGESPQDKARERLRQFEQERGTEDTDTGEKPQDEERDEND